LESLAKESDPAKRQELKKDELNQRINYLYNQAHEVASKVVRIRRTLDG